MATVPLPHQFAVGEEVTSTNINTYYSALSFLENPPICNVIANTTQSITNAWTKVNFNQNIFDTYNGHSTVTNNTRYTAQVAGYYYIYAVIPINPTTTSGMATCIAVNNVQAVGSATSVGPSAIGTTGGIAVLLTHLNINDYIEVEAFASATTGTITSGAPFAPSLTVMWLHA